MKKLILILLPLFVIACQTKNTDETAEGSSKNKLEIKNPWLSPSVAGSNSAMFFHVLNNTDTADTLYDVKCSFDEISMIHETYMNNDGTTGMRHVESVVIPPHSDIEFKPGGRHVMLMNLKSDLLENDTMEVTLQFKDAGSIKVKTPVKNLF